MALLDSIQNVYLLLGQDAVTSEEEDGEDQNIRQILLRENKNILAGYNWRFATVSTKLYPLTDDEIKAVGLEDAKHKDNNYFQYPKLGDSKHPDGGAFTRLICVYDKRGENLMEYEKEELEMYDWTIRGHGFFINATDDEWYRIDYIAGSPSFGKDHYNREYPANYLRALEYKAALQAAQRISPDANLKQELLALHREYLDMAISTDVRMIIPKVKKSRIQLPWTRRWAREEGRRGFR